MYIADTDLVVEGFLNRPGVSRYSVNFWKRVEQTKKTVCITRIGLKRISVLFESMVNDQEKVESMIEGVNSCFTILEVSPEMIRDARKLKTKDFESAIEIICAKTYKANAIITDRKEVFQSPENNCRIKYVEPNDFIDNDEAFYPKTVIHIFFNVFANAAFAKTLFFNLRLTIHFIQCFEALRMEVLNHYIKIAHKYGGLDRGYYSEDYDVIEANWENFQEVLEYCSKRAVYSSEYYRILISLWDNLNRFSDLYSHREERLYWLAKIIKLSCHYQKKDDYFCALTRKSWILVMQEKYKEAKKTLNLAAKEIDNNSYLSSRYFHCCNALNTRIDNLEQVKNSLELQLSSVARLEGKIDDYIYAREYINFRGDTAKLLSKRVIIKIENGKEMSNEDQQDLQLSLDYFRVCLDKSESINWQRGISYFLNKIADVLLILASKSKSEQEKQQLIKESDALLKIGIKIAERNKNHRRLVAYNKSLAKLANLQNDPQEAKEKLEMALEILEKIGENERVKQCLVEQIKCYSK